MWDVGRMSMMGYWDVSSALLTVNPNARQLEQDSVLVLYIVMYNYGGGVVWFWSSDETGDAPVLVP